MVETASGIGELIAQLKQDGVAAGEKERLRIVDAAHEEAGKIVAEARREAAGLQAEAEDQAEELRRQLEAELRLVARDFMTSFRQRIRQQLIEPLVARETSSVVNDPDFLKEAIKELCVGFLSSGGESLQVIVPESRRQELEEYFLANLESALERADVKVTGEPGLEGFRLTRDGASYAWDFSLATIARELQALVEPSLREYFSLDAESVR